MRTSTNFLFYTVLAGHVINIIATLALIGTFVPASTSGEAGGTLMVCFIAAILQILALYKTAKESTKEYAMGVAVPVMIVTFVGIVFFSKASGGYYVSPGDLLIAMLFAALSCGTLLWLRSKDIVAS